MMLKEKLICSSCGREFDRTSKQRPRFCSNACKQKAYRDRQKLLNTPLGEFRQESRWVRARGKRPLQLSGRYASSTNPKTWATFDQVQSSSVGDGFGVMLGQGLGCYDIDHCFNGGSLKGWVRDYIESIPEKVIYMEVSKSGEGLHLFFLATDHGRGSNRGGVERYVQDRFIRTTFDTFTL